MGTSKEAASDGGEFHSVGIVQWEPGYQPRMMTHRSARGQTGNDQKLVGIGALLLNEEERVEGLKVIKRRQALEVHSRPFKYLHNVEIIVPRFP